MFQILLSMFNNHYHHLRNKVFQVVEKLYLFKIYQSCRNPRYFEAVFDNSRHSDIIKICSIMFLKSKKVEIPLNSKWTSFCGNLKNCMAVMQ